ncbi:MAG: hypothetical protein N2749_04565 [Clostridia bacterium]|nr:hypothetical protein [Clostridia bacterium]
MKTNNEFSTVTPKVKIVISYIISIFGLIFLYFDKSAQSEEVVHYKQSATIFILMAATNIITSVLSGAIPFIGFIGFLINLTLFAYSIIALIRAYKHDEFYEIPIVYDLSQKIFKK